MSDVGWVALAFGGVLIALALSMPKIDKVRGDTKIEMYKQINVSLQNYRLSRETREDLEKQLVELGESK